MLTEDEESLKERGSTLQKNKMLTEDEESLKKLDQKLLQSYLLRVPWRLKASVKNRLLLGMCQNHPPRPISLKIFEVFFCSSDL